MRRAALAIVLACGLGAATAVAEEPAAVTAAPKSLGDPAAPVKIIEYASLSCPHCAEFHTERMPWLKQTYIDTGRVRFEFRDFPLNAPALWGSMLAHCAGPDRYYAWLDLLFGRQRDWAVGSTAIGGGNADAFFESGCPKQDWPEVWHRLAGVGKLAGMGEARLQSCLCDQDLADAIIRTRSDGQKEFDIESTPSLVIDGEVFPGVPSEDELSKRIEDAGG